MKGGKDTEIGAPIDDLDKPRGEEGTEARAAEKTEDPEVESASAFVKIEPLQKSVALCQKLFGNIGVSVTGSM